MQEVMAKVRTHYLPSDIKVRNQTFIDISRISSFNLLSKKLASKNTLKRRIVILSLR